jgi:hypothetical protein
MVKAAVTFGVLVASLTCWAGNPYPPGAHDPHRPRPVDPGDQTGATARGGAANAQGGAVTLQRGAVAGGQGGAGGVGQGGAGGLGQGGQGGSAAIESGAVNNDLASSYEDNSKTSAYGLAVNFTPVWSPGSPNHCTVHNARSLGLLFGAFSASKSDTVIDKVCQQLHLADTLERTCRHKTAAAVRMIVFDQWGNDDLKQQGRDDWTTSKNYAAEDCPAFKPVAAVAYPVAQATAHVDAPQQATTMAATPATSLQPQAAPTAQLTPGPAKRKPKAPCSCK